MKRSNVLDLGLVCIVSSCITACSLQEAPGTIGSEERDTSRSADATEAAPRTLLAEVKLTGTHVVEFWEYESGQVMVLEDRHVDLDRPMDIDILRKSLQYNYLNLIAASERDHLDPVALDRLNAADLRVQARWQATGFDPLRAAENIVNDLSPVDTTGITEAGLPSLSGGASTNATCSEPEGGWDWAGDDAWFADNFCFSCSSGGVPGCHYPVNQLCIGSVSWSERAYRDVTWYRAFAFAQAFCNTARFRVWDKCQSFPLGGIVEKLLLDRTVNPRFVSSAAWTTSCDIKSRVDGNPGPTPQRIGHGIQFVWDD